MFRTSLRSFENSFRFCMKTNYLDYSKLILDKVCFREDLLRKEYRKALNWLKESEQEELNKWVKDRGYPSLLCTDEHHIETMRGGSMSDLKKLTV